jgi:Domain of unknown function (DUF1707)
MVWRVRDGFARPRAACHRCGVADLRASDADREQVIRALRRHHADGRITSEELDERIGTVWATKYESELGLVTADLPDLPAPAPAPPPPSRRRPRMPGRADFSAQWESPAPPEDTIVSAMQHLAPALSVDGYGLVERTPDRAVFARPRTPGWVWFVVVLAFPFGLLALLARTEDRVAIEFVPRGEGGTLVYAAGVAPLTVRRAFADLEEG